MNRLLGKVIVVVGGTSGIGLSAARACVEEGARVVAVGLDDEQAARAETVLGDGAVVLRGDARGAQTAGQAIEEGLRRFGGFDGLYHVAGGSGRRKGDGPLHELTDEGWQFTVELNLTSMIYSNRAAVGQLLAMKKGGSILNLSSVLAYSPAPAYFATHAYAASKAGVIGLSRAAAAYYAKDNVRVNVLCPGLIDTPMAKRALADEAIGVYVSTKQPLDGGRPGRPDDLDGAAIYFLSDESRFVTGQVLAVDGGWSASEGRSENRDEER